MKLFQQMLVAPAALGLLAPLAANAAEVNINDVASYTTPGTEVTTAQFSDVVPGDWAYTALQNLSESTGCVDNVYAQNLNSGQSLTRYEAAALLNSCLEGGLASADSDAIRLTNEFGTEMAILKGRVDGLEYKVEELSAGAFASATKLTGSSAFTTGFIDTANTANNKLTSEYNYKVDINSSFTGMDRLYAGVEAGNQDDLVLDSQVTGGNGLSVNSLFYTFPVGEFEITAGPLFDQDDVISATTSVYSDKFRLASMPWGAEGETGAGAAVSYVNENGFNGSVSVVAVGAATATTGAFTDEGQDVVTASFGYDADNYGGGIIYKDDDGNDDSIGAGVYFRPDNFPSISLAIDKLRESGQTDSKNFLIGLDHEVGSGVASAAFQAEDTRGTTVNNYELYYTYPINDGMSVMGGMFVEEESGIDNTQGFVVETTFTF